MSSGSLPSHCRARCNFRWRHRGNIVTRTWDRSIGWSVQREKSVKNFLEMMTVVRSRHRFLLKSSPSFLIFRFFFLFNNSFLLFFFQNFPHRLFLQTFLLYNVQTYKRGKYLCYKEWRGGRSEEKFTSLITDISVISWRIRGDTRENSKMAAICVEFFFFLFLLTFNKILYIYIYICIFNI